MLNPGLTIVFIIRKIERVSDSLLGLQISGLYVAELALVELIFFVIDFVNFSRFS